MEYTEDINDNGEFFAKIDEPLKRNQSIDRDIVVLTDWMAGRMINLGYVAPLDDAKFPNKANLVDSVKDVSFDPGRKYTVPWLSGMTGVGYNPKKTGRELTSINDIFDPKFKGQVTMLTEMRDTIGLVMLGLGKDPAKVTKADVAGRRRQDQEGADQRADPEVHRQRLRRGPGGRQHRDRVRLVGRHPGAGGRQPGPPVDRAQGRRHALLGQHDDPQDLGPAGRAMTWINYVYDPKHSAQIVAGAPYLSRRQGHRRRAGQDRARPGQEPAGEPARRPPRRGCTSSAP